MLGACEIETDDHIIGCEAVWRLRHSSVRVWADARRVASARRSCLLAASGHTPILDNGSIYTALETICTAERLNLLPITTPAASPQSNGMSEAFVNTLKA